MKSVKKRSVMMSKKSKPCHLYEIYENTYGVYYLFCRGNGKYYIGSSHKFIGRLVSHKNLLRQGIHTSIYMQNAWNDYGEESFEIGLIEYCTVKNRWILENKWIKFYKKQDLLLNIIDEAVPAKGLIGDKNGMYGKHHTDSAKKLISETHKGKEIYPHHLEICRLSMIENQEKYQAILKNIDTTTKSQWQDKNKREFEILSPNGELMRTKGLAEFCRNNDLDIRDISKLLRGKTKSHLGWRLPENKLTEKFIVSPERKIIKFLRQSEIVKKYNIRESGLSLLLSGKITVTLGWIICPVEYENCEELPIEIYKELSKNKIYSASRNKG